MIKDFKDIVLLTNDMTEGMKSQQKEMNESKEIILEEKYPDGIECICGKKIIFMKSHVNSSKHKRFCNKHGINIKVKLPPPRILKPKKPKGPKGRPRIYSINETEEERKKRFNRYAMNFLDENPDKRKKHNERVAKFRKDNRELCRQRVRESRKRKKEKELQKKLEV